MQSLKQLLAITLLMLPYAAHAADLSGVWQTTE